MRSINRKKVVILGAGYAGVLAAKGLGKLAAELGIDVLLVNKHDYHQIITQLHESAAGTKDGDAIRVPLARIFKDELTFIKGEVTAILPKANQVVIDEDKVLEYDYLVVALGSDPEYYNIPGLKEHSFALRSLNAARMIKVHIENCLARYKVNPQEQGLLNFVVGGAGFTGLEIIGELAEWLPNVAPKFDVSLKEIRLICVEGSAQVLPGLDEFLSNTAASILHQKGVELKLGTPIKELTGDYLLMGEEKLPTRTVIWTGGVRGNKSLEAAGFSCNRGRAIVNEKLQSIDFENVFIIGDCSYLADKMGKPFPPTAQLAIQQGQYLVKSMKMLLNGQELVPFSFDNKGVVASVGQKDAVGVIFGKYRLQGKIAMLMKKLINLRYLFILAGLPLVLEKLWDRPNYRPKTAD